MTDKQIIIDGVDVSGCKKYEREIVRCNATLKNMCFCGGRCTDKKNADCYFKQLKRKEQELQEAMDNYVQLDLQRVKEYNELVELYKAKEQECNKYKQTLAEIKEIAEDFYLDGEHVKDKYLAQEILQKIRKCDEENKYNIKDIRHINKNQEYIV